MKQLYIIIYLIILLHIAACQRCNCYCSYNSLYLQKTLTEYFYHNYEYPNDVSTFIDYIDEELNHSDSINNELTTISLFLKKEKDHISCNSNWINAWGEEFTITYGNDTLAYLR